jgi:hypothetical protein
MIIRFSYLGVLLAFGALVLTACTAAKLEARLEANPQCKEVINPKTGALMPCPGTDRAFYRAAGLEPLKPTAPTTAQTASAPTTAANSAPPASQPDISQPSSKPRESAASKADCKPTIHNKTGGLMPCLPPD